MQERRFPSSVVRYPSSEKKERRRRRGPAKCGLTGRFDSEPDDKPSDKGKPKSFG